jgi:hypothetical protein
MRLSGNCSATAVRLPSRKLRRRVAQTRRRKFETRGRTWPP